MNRYLLRYKSEYFPEYCFDPDENTIYTLSQEQVHQAIENGIPFRDAYQDPNITSVNVSRDTMGHPACLIRGKYIRMDWLVAFTMYGQPDGIVRLLHLDNDPDNYQWQNLKWLLICDIKQKFCQRYGVESVFDIPELWKPIQAPKNPRITWMVSNRGEVKLGDTIINPSIDSVGYPRIQYVDENGNPTAVSIHNLVAQLYLPNPNNWATVAHLDGNKRNNHFWNLEWTPESPNSSQNSVSNIRKAALSADVVEKICSAMASGMPTREICQEFGVDVRLISEIRTGKRWKHIADRYEFVDNRFSSIQKLKMVEMIQSGLKSKDIASEMGLEHDTKLVSMYNRLRRYLMNDPQKIDEIREKAKKLVQ